jgi:hypothetical protein
MVSFVFSFQFLGHYKASQFRLQQFSGLMAFVNRLSLAQSSQVLVQLNAFFYFIFLQNLTTNQFVTSLLQPIM